MKSANSDDSTKINHKQPAFPAHGMFLRFPVFPESHCQTGPHSPPGRRETFTEIPHLEHRRRIRRQVSAPPNTLWSVQQPSRVLPSPRAQHPYCKHLRCSEKVHRDKRQASFFRCFNRNGTRTDFKRLPAAGRTYSRLVFASVSHIGAETQTDVINF